LAVATTAAFGTFGIVSALYSEITKDPWEQSGKIIASDLLGFLVMTSISVSNFAAAWLVIKKEEKKRVSERVEVTKH
jgi:hypothetical protein